jgi:hypothetical protein
MAAYTPGKDIPEKATKKEKKKKKKKKRLGPTAQVVKALSSKLQYCQEKKNSNCNGLKSIMHFSYIGL